MSSLPKSQPPPDRIKSDIAPKAKPVDPKNQYVVGGALNWFPNIPHTLSHEHDTISRRLGSEILERMMMDPDVYSSVQLCVENVLADGVQTRNRLKAKDPNFGKAQKISDFCGKQLTRLNKPFLATLKSILMDMFVHGNKVAEKKWEIQRMGPYRGKLMLQELRPLPRRATAFVVDAYMNLLGLVGVRADIPMNILPGGGSWVDMSRVIPTSKFFIATIDSKDNDPRGWTQIGCAHNAWSIKQAIWPEGLRFINFSAVPGVILIASEAKDKEEPLRKPDGTIVLDANGDPIYQTAEQLLAAAGEQLGSHKVLAVPGGTKVHLLETKSSGQVFTGFMELLGEQIAKAIMFVTLANREGRGSSTRAASATHMAMFEIVIWWLKNIVSLMIEDQIYKPAIRYNFGEVALEWLPQCSLGDKPIPNFNEIAQGIAQLVGQGALDEGQLPEADAKMGFQPRDLENRKPAILPEQNLQPKPFGQKSVGK